MILGLRKAGWGVAILVFYAHTAAGQEADIAARSAARKLGYAGVESYQTGNYVGANEKLEKAYRVLRAPSLGLWSARALVKVGKLVEASERYLEVTRLEIKGGELAVQQKAQTDAAAELQALAPTVPSVVVDLEGAKPNEVKILLDGAPMSSELVGEWRPVNPGQHTVFGDRSGDRASADVTLNRGEQKHVALKFEGQKAPGDVALLSVKPMQDAQLDSGSDHGGSNFRRPASYVLLGLGGAALVTGGVAGLMALGQSKTLRDNPACIDRQCPSSESGAVDRYNTVRAISTVGFIAGGVLAATGIVLLSTAPSASQKSAEVWVSPTSVGVSGRF